MRWSNVEAECWQSGGAGIRGEDWNEDDHQSGDEGGFCRRRVSESCGLELISGCEEEADDESGEQGSAADVAKLAVVDNGERDEGQGHAQKIEEER